MSIFDIARGTIEDEEQRLSELKLEVVEIITLEGGTVTGMIPVGLLFRSPFPALFWKPLYLRIRCRYPSDTGEWIVCNRPNQPTCWCWRSDNGINAAPISRIPPAAAKNDIICLPNWTQYIVGIGLLVGIPVIIYLLYPK